MNPEKNEKKEINKDFERKYIPEYPYVDIESMANDLLEWIEPAKEKPKEQPEAKKKKIKRTYPQDWSSYNKAQQLEKVYLMRFLDELLDYIPFPERKSVGRNPVSPRDKIFYLALQSYNLKSSRRCISDLQIAKRLGYIDKAPHFNTVLKCMKDRDLISYLKHLISVSGLPLQQIETDFAVDSSGFSTSQFGRWLDVRFDEGKKKERRKFVKAHITCGVKTNIITAVNITKGYSGDSPQFPDLVLQTSKMYDIAEVSADKAYLSRENFNVVNELGGIAFIPFKKNVLRKGKTQRYGSYLWKKMFKYFTENQEEFMEHYHKRSNCESTFYMLKRKFDSHLRSKDEFGQQNEILAKCLCHNICVLIQEMFELGIAIDFKKCAEIPIAHKH
ncbi:MAG: transposase [Candidatus Aenigmarchaeota archaeon]|nr:transposase [Candidatus Aenigmarchaeota archaeon]